MSQSEPNSSPPNSFWQSIQQHQKLWLVPAIVIFVAASAYAFIRPPTWKASMGLLIRDEAVGVETHLGRFSHLDEMKSVQETIVELAKSRPVIEAALKSIGPPNDESNSTTWPTNDDVEDALDALRLSAPNGSEFGKTEVFYLSVKDKDRRRAMDMAMALFQELDRQYRRLRDERAQSLVTELTNMVKLADADFEEANRVIAEFENRVGENLAELRILNESSSGESNLRRTLGQVDTELRQVKLQSQANKKLLEILTDAKADSSVFVTTPNSLLASYPSLTRLKDGLVDAQLATSQVLGVFTDSHPQVQAARNRELSVRNQLREELQHAIRGLETEQQLNSGRQESLGQRLDELEARMARLAQDRVQYQSLLAEVENRRQILQEVQSNLTEARSIQAGAREASLITRLDLPRTGQRPEGPSRAMIILGGLVGGLLTGFGFVCVAVPPITTTGNSFRPETITHPPRPASHPSTHPATPVRTENRVSFRQALAKVSVGPESHN